MANKQNAEAGFAAAHGSAAASSVEVLHEEIITHPDAIHRVNGWRGEARVMGAVRVNGRTYEFDQVVSLRLRDPDRDDD
jgi:predicted Zn-dependent protease